MIHRRHALGLLAAATFLPDRGFAKVSSRRSEFRNDLQKRFFDHFLKGAPMPVWMKEGIPATEKGRTMGTELAKP